jgi:putative DNA primase/helicase
MTCDDQLRAAMRQVGLDYGASIAADGKLHRFKVKGDHARNSWYVLHPGPPAAGSFGCWKRDLKETWCERNSELSQAEWAAVRQTWAKADRERERAQAERHAKARKVAAWIFERAKPLSVHPYLTAKRVKALGEVRQYRGALVLPLCDGQGELQSLQFISASGAKRFLAFGRVTGCFFSLAENPDGPLVICEGYATGATVHEATGYAVIAAMNCGNLLSVANALHLKSPLRVIIICADNDAWTDCNPGLTKATEAANTIRGRLAVPRFKDSAGKPTDFNDLHRREGLNMVKKQIEKAETPKETDEHAYERLAKLSLADYDRCREQEADRLGIRVGILDIEVGRHRAKAEPNQNTQSGAVRRSRVEPWEDPVNGGDLLDSIVKTYRRFCKLPPYAAEALAVWVLQTYCYRGFEFVAVIVIWSPEHECGKGRVLDVTEKLAHNPFRTSNTSAAVLYHSVGEGDITVLIDEIDSQNEAQREAIGNVLKSGFQSNGKAHRMADRNGEQVCVEFSTFSPKMLATIGLDCLDKATRSRSIPIRMHRKQRNEKLEKFRRYDGTEIQRKCLRWVQDNRSTLKCVVPIQLNECATDRQEDVWEPLVHIARAAGGEWEKRIREAASCLSGKANSQAMPTLGHQILGNIRDYFAEKGGSKADTKSLLEYLNKAEEFSGINAGRGLTPYLLSKALGQYGISSKNVKMPDGRVLKGYDLDDFKEIFEVYLAEDAAPSRYPATTPQNTGDSSLLKSATEGVRSASEITEISNQNGAGSGVADQKPGYPVEKPELANADLV